MALSRRSLVTSAAALPALSLPAAASVPACTLPPDLIAQFVRVREWFLEMVSEGEPYSREIDRRFHEASGVTTEQYFAMGSNDPRLKELAALHMRIIEEVPGGDEKIDEYGQTEADRLAHERWAVAREMLDHQPQTIVDLAWQAEAFLLTDLELFEPPHDSGEQLIRILFQNIRTLGALPQPNDPFGALKIGIEEAA